MSHNWPEYFKTSTIISVSPCPGPREKGSDHVAELGPPGVGRVCKPATQTHLLLMVSITPRRMIMNMRRPAITPAIFTVLSTCFSGSTVLEFWVEAPWRGKGRRKMLKRLTHVTRL